jgi:deoxyribodipyrimidine photo-lyase
LLYMKTTIIWFRNDLRIHDHPALHAAAEESDRIVPVFICNDILLHGKHASANRNRFLLESLQDLAASLRDRGSDLVIRHGRPQEVLRSLAHETQAQRVHISDDFTPYARKRDELVASVLAQDGIEFCRFPGRLMVDDVQGITTGAGTPFKVFTPFWKVWARVDRRPVLPLPAVCPLPEGITVGTLPALKDLTSEGTLSSDVAAGGEQAALRRLKTFLDDHINSYAAHHNDLGADGSSRLSPYLHFGCLSARTIEDQLGQGEGADAFHRQLAWRDFYQYILWHFPDNAHQEYQARYRQFGWSDDPALLDAWQDGQTGYPVVDAAMRQLKQEGWMHNRGRLIVGSFLTKDLGLDWRLGEAHFMHWLLDGDEANNNGNWQWIASVGVDPAPVFRRLYNPTSQQASYDPQGAYVRRYVPELANVDDAYLAEPWKMSDEQQQQAGCIIGKDYPAPVVDHAQARRAALERYRSAA